MASTSSVEQQHGTELVGGAVYEFHRPGPGQRIEVEIVFMHGLQLKSGGLKSAYFETWRTRNGQEVWAQTWLKEKFPHARILSLAYDSSAWKTLEAGNTRPSMLGASLLEQMVLPEANIGQHGCPVIFVCHSLGGLIAKEIVVSCHSAGPDNPRYRNLLQNIRALFFYATPHGGSDLPDLAGLLGWVPGVETSSLVEYLKRNATMRGQVHANFLELLDGDMKNCKIWVVAEGQKTKGVQNWCSFLFSKWVVRENSARFPGVNDFIMLNHADHMTVCKPQNREDFGYLKLTSCISQVIKEHSSSVSVYLPVEPIGIDSMITKVCGKLESSEVSVVGLFGMGGLGKTTLSKMVYNRKAIEYAKSCYLEEVKSRKVEDVQKQLLRDLCAEKMGQDDPVEKHHLDMIEKCFATERVLVVFDDVTSESKKVLPAFEPGSESKVIVTGRDRGILPKHEKSGKASIVLVDVKGIRDDEGSDMQLFAQYAYKSVDEDVKERVKDRFQKVANDIVKLCNGLPLSLEVIGAYLGTEYKGDDEGDLRRWTKLWTDAYEKLQTAQSLDGSANDKLWSSLRVSYDGLAPRERAMFLDFACIFSEGGDYYYRMDDIKLIWDSESGVQNLLNKSLLREGKSRYGGDFLAPWFLLWGMSPMFIRQRALKEEEKDRPIVITVESRVIGDEFVMLYPFLGIESIYGEIKCNYGEIKINYGGDKFRDLCRHILLMEKSGDKFVIHDQLRDMGRHLLLKEEKDRPIYLISKRLSTWGGVQELKGCNNTGVSLVAGSEQWKGSQTPLYYSKLRFLHVEHCKEASLLDDCLSECSRELRWLSLRDSKFTNRGMQKLGSFEGLRVLEIYGCDDLVELPLNIDNLKNLGKLQLNYCEKVRVLPNSIGKLKKLKVLVVECCGLESIPRDVGNLIGLEHLSFDGSGGIKSDQQLQFCCVDRLKVLKLPYVPTTCLPPCLELEELWVEPREEVDEFPLDFFKVDMPKLRSVTIDGGLKCRKLVLYNPDGSALQAVLETGYFFTRLKVTRDPSDGSFKKLKKGFRLF